MNQEIAEIYLQDTLESFRNYKNLAEKALAQISDEEFFRALDDQEVNSVAVIVKHIAGNLRSRWTDFLTSDGEKPDRNRDSEFVAHGETREDLSEFWEIGWQAVLATVESLKPEDLEKTVKIRGEDYTVVKAINRAVTHAAYHVGQIVFLAKHFRRSEWKTLSVPRNKSAEFNAFLHKQNKETGEPLNRFEAGQIFSEIEKTNL